MKMRGSFSIRLSFVMIEGYSDVEEVHKARAWSGLRKTRAFIVQKRSVDQQADSNSNSVKGGQGSERDSVLPKGKCPQNESSLLERMNEFVEIGQTMGFDMGGCLSDIEKLISRQGDGVVYQ
ncbi:hypothetical protein Tco_1567135 [Tanacetum coccineum]